MTAPFRVLLADPPWLFGDRLPKAGRGASKHFACMPIEEIAAFELPPLANDCALFLWRVSGGARNRANEAYGERWLPDRAFDVIRAWGFEYKTEIVWNKCSTCARCKGSGRVAARVSVEQLAIPESIGSKWIYAHKGVALCPKCNGRGTLPWFGMGRYVRGAHETCLVATRGKMVPKSKSVRSSFEAVVPRRNGEARGTHSAKPEALRALVETMFDGPYVELFARGVPPPGWTFFGHEAVPTERPADKVGPDIEPMLRAQRRRVNEADRLTGRAVTFPEEPSDGA